MGRSGQIVKLDGAFVNLLHIESALEVLALCHLFNLYSLHLWRLTGYSADPQPIWHSVMHTRCGRFVCSNVTRGYFYLDCQRACQKVRQDTAVSVPESVTALVRADAPHGAQLLSVPRVST
jgi:hypothetical protein